MPPSEPILRRIPVVAGLAYIERVRQLPSTFTAELVPERENRYFRHAIAVKVGGDKVGYIAPEVAPRYYGPLLARGGSPVTCPGRRATSSDHQTSGVELMLDFSALDVMPED